MDTDTRKSVAAWSSVIWSGALAGTKLVVGIITGSLGILSEALHSALARYEEMMPRIRELEAYYTGPQWKRDYEDDCAGRLPEGLKRGVLSEDAVYDLLSMLEDLRRMGRQI